MSEARDLIRRLQQAERDLDAARRAVTAAEQARDEAMSALRMFERELPKAGGKR